MVWENWGFSSWADFGQTSADDFNPRNQVIGTIGSSDSVCKETRPVTRCPVRNSDAEDISRQLSFLTSLVHSD